MNFSLKYLRFGENSILIEWPEAIQKKILMDIIQFKCSIVNANLQFFSISILTLQFQSSIFG